MRFRKTRHARGIEFSMTSMVDVITNIVVFFLIVQQFSQMEREELHLAPADQARTEATAPTRLVVNLLSDGQLVVSGRRVDLDVLSGLLRAERERLAAAGRQNELTVLVRADADVPYARVQAVMLEAAALNLWRLSFAAAAEEERAP
jgi:biopolymer transport protein ExbD